MTQVPEPRATHVSRETSARLRLFSDLLLRWTRTVNLVARADQDAIERRHIQDSLRLLPHLPAGARLLMDLGSGGGFPGLVLAIATGRHFTLVESDARKCAFLLEAARVTAAPVTVVNQRIETLAAGQAELITARALAPLPRLLELCRPLLLPGGSCLFLKGSAIAAELTEARAGWDFTGQMLEQEAGEGCILRVSDLSPIHVPP